MIMRPTRSSQALEIARRRLERLQSITPIPDFGTGFSIKDYGKDSEEYVAAGGVRKSERKKRSSKITSSATV